MEKVKEKALPSGRRAHAAGFATVLALVAAALLPSCAAGVTTTLAADGSARVQVNAEIPAVAAERIRRLAGLDAEAHLFDPVSLSRALARRPGIIMVSASAPGPSSLKAEFQVRDLAALAADQDIAAAGLLRLTVGPGWDELGLNLERGKGAALAALFPGVDPSLVEALSPPLVTGDDLSAAEYREMLASILGERTMAVLDVATIRVRVTAPGPVLSSSGGSLSGATLSLDLPALGLLALERPVGLSLRWKR